MAIACVPTWIACLIYGLKYGKNVTLYAYYFMANMLMLTPALASIITRVATREGFKNNLMKFNLKGNLKYYAMGVLVTLGYILLNIALNKIFLLPDVSFSEMFENADLNLFRFLLLVLYLVYMSVSGCFFTLGEELGWRGYMMPKLEELMGTPSALIVGGVIWGLWHAPMVILGHNFGTDYVFYPWLGIILMCLFCVFIGSFYTYLTKKTNSVFPAVAAHLINNNGSSYLSAVLLFSLAAFSDIDTMKGSTGLIYQICGIFPVMIVGIVSFMKIVVSERKNKMYVS